MGAIARWVVGLIFVAAAVSCIPVKTERNAPQGAISIRVPATAGLTVEVRAGRLFDADPGWLESSQHLDTIGITFNGEPVDCDIMGGADGRLDAGDSLVFRTGTPNRHSPYLTYQIVRRDKATGDGAGGPSAPGCRIVDALSSLDADRFVVDVPRPETTTLPEWSRDIDYLAVAPRDHLDELQPLIALRTGQKHRVLLLAVEDIYETFSFGNPDPRAIQTAVRRLHAYTGGRLRYLLLVGDVSKHYEPAADAATPVATWYDTKIHYPGYFSHKEFPSDHPYGVVQTVRRGRKRPPAEIAVGRLPVNNAPELRDMVAKITEFETDSKRGDWQRRLILFGGPANYGRFIDSIIESQATWLLNDVLPYNYDLDFTFAKPDSPYAWRLDKLGPKLVSSLDRGALFAAYFGHGLETAFDNVVYRRKLYPIGTRSDLSKVNIVNGAPLFLSFTCHTGAFDGPRGARSLAEVLALNPRGPVAVFASSRASHPYNNALYAQGFIDTFLKSQPKTIGDGLLELKADAVKRRILLAEALVKNDISALKREHEGLYNLLGDPATRLPYPASLPVSVEPATNADAGPGGVSPGKVIRITVGAPRVGAGTARVTLETERATIRGKVVSSTQLDDMPVEEAFDAMTTNHQIALNKVVETQTVAFGADSFELMMMVPTAPGRYVVKVLAEGDRAIAVGHAIFQVSKGR